LEVFRILARLDLFDYAGQSLGLMSDLFEKARAVRLNAHAPYSKFRVGAALRTKTGKEFVGCNVENSAYPQGTCAEAGAIAAMIAAGEKEIAEICICGRQSQPDFSLRGLPAKTG
jgi:cytidine deaminase